MFSGWPAPLEHSSCWRKNSLSSLLGSSTKKLHPGQSPNQKWTPGGHVLWAGHPFCWPGKHSLMALGAVGVTKQIPDAEETLVAKVWVTVVIAIKFWVAVQITASRSWSQHKVWAFYSSGYFYMWFVPWSLASSLFSSPPNNYLFYIFFNF